MSTARIRNGLLVSPTGQDFKDALAGISTPVDEKLRTRLAQTVDVTHLNQQYY